MFIIYSKCVRHNWRHGQPMTEPIGTLLDLFLREIHAMFRLMTEPVKNKKTLSFYVLASEVQLRYFCWLENRRVC
jgi:hypothetical protein